MERFKNPSKKILVLLIALSSLSVYSKIKSEPVEKQNENTVPHDSIDVITKPEKVSTYLDRGKWILNFDFWLKNFTNQTLIIQSIELLVYSKDKNLSYRKLMSNNGLPGSLSTINRTLSAQDDLYLFNPFYQLPEEVRPYKLVFRFNFGATTKEVEIYPEINSSDTFLKIPVKGKVIIEDGNDYYSHHRRVSLNSEPAMALNMNSLAQRFALDFTKVDENGNFREKNITKNSDWFGWNLEVLSPAEGVVLSMRNNVADNAYTKNGELIRSDEVLNQVSDDISAGNYILIDHKNGEYSLLCHFKKGSITVKEGERIKQDQFLGNVGLSGDTYYPHLHYQLQTNSDIIDSYGIPIRFNNFIRHADSDKFVESGFVNSGDIVSTIKNN